MLSMSSVCIVRTSVSLVVRKTGRHKAQRFKFGHKEMSSLSISVNNSTGIYSAGLHCELSTVWIAVGKQMKIEEWMVCFWPRGLANVVGRHGDRAEQPKAKSGEQGWRAGGQGDRDKAPVEMVEGVGQKRDCRAQSRLE